MKYLEERFKLPVTDLTNDKTSQASGIDFMLGEDTVEFKIDNHINRTKRFAFELVSNIGKATPGCGLTSKATYLLIYDPVDNVCHRIHLPGLRNYLTKSSQVMWDVAKTATTIGKLESAYSGFYLLIPLKVIKDNPEVDYKIFKLKEYIESQNKDSQIEEMVNRFIERLVPITDQVTIWKTPNTKSRPLQK